MMMSRWLTIIMMINLANSKENGDMKLAENGNNMSFPLVLRVQYQFILILSHVLNHFKVMGSSSW